MKSGCHFCCLISWSAVCFALTGVPVCLRRHHVSPPNTFPRHLAAHSHPRAWGGGVSSLLTLTLTDWHRKNDRGRKRCGERGKGWVRCGALFLFSPKLLLAWQLSSDPLTGWITDANSPAHKQLPRMLSLIMDGCSRTTFTVNLQYVVNMQRGFKKKKKWTSPVRNICKLHIGV